MPSRSANVVVMDTKSFHKRQLELSRNEIDTCKLVVVLLQTPWANAGHAVGLAPFEFSTSHPTGSNN